LYQQIERIARTVNLTIDLEFNQSVSLINPEDEAIEASLETHEIEDFEMS
jgi:hypothetical protein